MKYPEQMCQWNYIQQGYEIHGTFKKIWSWEFVGNITPILNILATTSWVKFKPQRASFSRLCCLSDYMWETIKSKLNPKNDNLQHRAWWLPTMLGGGDIGGAEWPLLLQLVDVWWNVHLCVSAINKWAWIWEQQSAVAMMAKLPPSHFGQICVLLIGWQASAPLS